jgi:hypothetical protein
VSAVTNYGSIPTDIWHPGSGFHKLTSGQQRLWMFLCSQPDIRPTGVIALRPGAWSQAADGLTRQQVEADLAGLDAAGYTITDWGTDEVLVRWRMRDSKVHKNANLMVRIHAQLGTVYSAQIRQALHTELSAAAPELPAETGTLFDTDAPTPSPYPQGDGKGSRYKGIKAGGSVVDLTGATAEQARERPRPMTARQVAAAFDAFWGVYPRKVGKQRAEAEFAKAVTRVDLNTLLAAAMTYRDLPGRKPDYTLHASTWLHQDRWDDDHATQGGPVASRGVQRMEEHLAAKAARQQRRGQGQDDAG